MTDTVRAYIGLGSNQGQPARQVRDALRALGTLPGTVAVAASRLYLTPPWGEPEQPDFVNAVAALDTDLEPLAVLDELQALEANAGRRRTERRWGPRALDLDLLLYGDLRLDNERLTIPHPFMHERAFVLVPLLELAPDLQIPGHGPAADCLARLDQSGVSPLEEMA